MPTLGNALDFAKYEGRNLVVHWLGAAPSSPIKGQMYFNTADNTLYWYDGSGWVAAKGGSGTPTGAAGGDLSGSYPNPTIGAGKVLDTHVGAGAAIAESKLSLATDAVAGTGSRRTLGTGAQQAMPGNTRLDTIASPTGVVSMASQKLTSLATPTVGTDAANMAYVDNVAQGLAPKDSVRAATTGAITISTGLNSGDAIDGVTLANGDRVLVKDQAAPAENGIYVVAASPARATDMDAWGEVPAAFTFVEQGTVNADTGWVSTADAGGTLGTTAVTWAQFSGAGQVVAGAGLTKTGNSLDVIAGAGITVNADSVQVANNGVTAAMIADAAIDLASADTFGVNPITKGGTGQISAKAARESGLLSSGYYSTATHGAGTAILITQATHGLRAGRGLIVQVQEESTGNVVLADVSVASDGAVTVTFGVSVSANSMRVTVIG